MRLIGLGFFVALAFAGYNVLIKVASDRIHQVLGAVIIQSVALLFGLTVLTVLLVRRTPIAWTWPSARAAMAAGVCVGLGEIAYFMFMADGISAARGVPLVLGGTVALGAIISLVFLQDTLSPTQIIGIVLIVGGVFLVGN